MPHIAKRYFRTAKIKTNAGTTRIKPPANLRCSGDVSRFCSKNAVSVRFSMVRTAAANTSFHEMTKAKMADAVIPGRTSGRTTLVKAVKRVHPKVHAASSNSIGMPENRENVINTAKGKANVVWISARPKIVSSMPVRMNITAKGRANKGSGKARVSRIKNRNVSLPRNSKRDKAYPAGAPNVIDNTIVIAATKIEFFNALSMPAKFAKNVKLPRSNSGTNDLGKAFTASGDDNVFINRKYKRTSTQAHKSTTPLT